MSIPRIHYQLALSCGLLGVVFWWSMNWGVGLSPDSMFYLKQSMGLSESFSISQFEDKAPPFYPVMQYLAALLVGEADDGIRILHAVLYGLNTFLFAYLAYQVTGGSRLFAFVGVSFHVCSPTVYTIHSYALTEPLFISLFLSGLLSLRAYMDKRSKGWLVLAGSLVGLMVLTRFAGVFFLVSFSLFLLIVSSKDRFVSALMRLAYFLVPAVAISLIWTVLKLAIDSDVGSPRELQFHPFSWDQFLALFVVFSKWLFIDQSLPAFGILLAIAVHLAFQRFRADGLIIPAFTVFNGVFYAVFILISISFFDAYIPVDQRILLPCQYLALLFLLEASSSYLRVGSTWAIRAEAGVFASIFLVVGAATTLKVGVNNYHQGQGFMSRSMQEIELHGVVRNSAIRTIYTNAPELVLLHVGSPALLLPQITDPSSLLPNDELVSQLAEVLQSVEDGHAAIVYYNAVNWRTYLPSPEFFREQYGLVPGYVTNEGAIFSAPLR